MIKWQLYNGLNLILLARVLAMALCLSVTSRCSIGSGWTDLAGFGMGASFDQSYTVFSGTSGIYENNGTFLGNFVPNFWL